MSEYMTGSCHKLLGLPKVGTGVGAPRVGALTAHCRLSRRGPPEVERPRERMAERPADVRLSEGPVQMK